MYPNIIGSNILIIVKKINIKIGLIFYLCKIYSKMLPILTLKYFCRAKLNKPRLWYLEIFYFSLFSLLLLYVPCNSSKVELLLEVKLNVWSCIWMFGVTLWICLDIYRFICIFFSPSPLCQFFNLPTQITTKCLITKSNKKLSFLPTHQQHLT